MKDARRRRAVLIGPIFRSIAEARLLLARLGLTQREWVIAVDGGLSWARRAGGVRVDLAIGDWDSLKDRRLLARVEHLTLPSDKERSDFYYALGAAQNFGASEIIAVGFSGARLDHELAMILDCAGVFARGRKPPLMTVLGPEADLVFVFAGQKREIHGLRRGGLVSVFSLLGDAKGVSTQGLGFALKNDILPMSSRGLSNCAKGGLARVSVKHGVLLVIKKHGVKAPAGRT